MGKQQLNIPYFTDFQTFFQISSHGWRGAAMPMFTAISLRLIAWNFLAVVALGQAA
jgi:hypothetical protein